MNENILPKQETVALIGEYESAITSPIAILSGNPNIPLITPASTSLPFEDKIPFPLVGRTISHAFGEANATLELLQGVWNVTHVMVLYLKDAFGISLEAAFSKLNGEMEKPLTNVTRVGFIDANGVKQAMKEVKATKYRNIYVIAPQRIYDTILDSAILERIIGPDTKTSTFGCSLLA
jgi:ABC-type branched-subunit amino acid transport system substrate-binding protein